MMGWVVRGVGMALVHFVARTALAAGVAALPGQGSVLRMITLVAVVLIAVVWGGLDGITARRAEDAAGGRPDGVDRTMLWLKASVVAGVLAGLVSWIFTAISGLAVSNNSVFFEVTSGAAFTVLLVFIPAVISVSLGRWLAGRGDKTPEDPRPGKVERDRSAEQAPVVSGSSNAWSNDATDSFGSVRESRPYGTDVRDDPNPASPNLTKGDGRA